MKAHLSTQETINATIKYLTEIKPDGMYQVEIKKLPKKRTLKQNASLWLYLSIMAGKLNDAGYEMVVSIVGKQVEIPWTDKLLKQVVWDGIMFKMFNKASSTELETKEISEVYEVMNRFTSDQFGVGMDWPHEVKQ